MTIELLRTAKYKRNITYRELSSKTGLPVTVLSRYAKGHVLPNTARAKQLWRVLTKLVGLEPELRSRIKFDEDGYFDNTEIIGDFNILQQAANHALANFAGKRVTKVLTAAADGIPLATITLYIPKDILKKRDSVLIVDDMIKSGETQVALVNLARKAKAEISGVFSLVAVGEEWKRKLKPSADFMIEVITYVKAPYDLTPHY
jgi:adenine phosphoribosyltransferase